MRFGALRPYPPRLRRYLFAKTREAATHWNAGLSVPEIGVAIDHSDELTMWLLQRAVALGLLREKPDV